MERPEAKVLTFEEMLETRGYIVYTNVGHSMMPLLRERRDIIEIRKKGPGRCRKYDVVLYRRGEKYILHRILRVLPEGYLIAGDNNAFVERDITDEKIIGVLVRVIRNSGKGKRREITPENKGYQIYVHLWCDFYPLRMEILRVRNFVWRIGSRVKRRVLRK